VVEAEVEVEAAEGVVCEPSRCAVTRSPSCLIGRDFGGTQGFRSSLRH
jgi:hypothetical protein